MVAGMYPTGMGTPSADAGQNSRLLVRARGEQIFGISDKAGAASVTQSWTAGGSGMWFAMAVRLAEAAANEPSLAAVRAYRHLLVR